MILKNPNSRLSIVNLLSDFILNKIPHSNHTIIEVADCINFFVIKGKTTHKELIDIGSTINEFKEKYGKNFSDFSSRKLTNTIDLIEYNDDLKELETLTFDYYNTENCSYSGNQIDAYLENDEFSYDEKERIIKISDNDSLIVKSEFPHGHSLSRGRLFYYYGKYITYNIPPSYPFNHLSLTISKNHEENFKVLNYEDLTSPILDVFDFDMKLIETEIKKVDWSIELTNPLQDYDFLKVKIKDFLII